MKEITTYICEICGGTYSAKEVALKCESAGTPKHFNEFVDKWIILPIQVLVDRDIETASSVDSYVEFLPVRVEANSIVGPSSFDFLNQLKFIAIAHSLKLQTRTFSRHNVIKEFLDKSLVIPESYYPRLTELLVESEMNKMDWKDNSPTMHEVKELVEAIAKEHNFSLVKPEGVEKYEYNSNI